MNIRKIIIMLLLLGHHVTQSTETIAQTLSSLTGETIIGLNLSVNDIGQAMAVWGVNNSGSYSVQAAYFDGTSWSPATTISDGDGGLSPWVFLNNNGKAVAAWQTNMGTGKVLSNTFLLGSGGWQGVATVQDPAIFQTPTSGYPNSRVRVGVDPLGNAVVVWLEVDNSATPTQYFLQGAFAPGNNTQNANNWNFYPHITLNTDTSLEVFFDPNSQVFLVFNISDSGDALIFALWTQKNDGVYVATFPSTNIHLPSVVRVFESTTGNAISNSIDFNSQGDASLASVIGSRVFRIAGIQGMFSECDLSAGLTNLLFNFWTSLSSAPKPLLHQAVSMQQQAATSPFPQPGYRIALQSATILNCSAVFPGEVLSIDRNVTYPRLNAMINTFYDNTALLFWNSQGGSPANNRIGIMQYDGSNWDTEALQFINANLVDAAAPSNDLPFYAASSRLANNGQHYVGLIWWDSVAGQVQSLFGKGTYTALVPSPATNLTATSANCSTPSPSITITWALSPDSNINNQYVYRDSGPGTPFVNISGALSNTITSFEDSTISAGTTYQYFVRVESIPGITSDSVIIADQCVNNKPDAVSLNAQCATTENGTAVAVNLTWNYAGALSLQKFQIYRSSQSDLLLVADNIAPSARSYKDTTAEAGSVYVYYAYAVSTAGVRSDPSLPAEVGPCNVDSPPAPTDLSAECNSSTSLTLNWTPAPSSANITSQSIYRYGHFLASVSPSTSSYTDSTILPDAEYIYEIKSVAGNPPLYSEAVSILAGGCVASMPDAPTGVTATCTEDGINVTWVASPTANITLYNIYRYGLDLIATVNIAENGGQYLYKDTQVEQDINYYYTVSAVSSEDVESDKASSNSIVCHPDAPEQIHNLSATCAGGSITITWLPPTNNVTSQTLYKDGNLIATLGSTTALYNDYAVSLNTPYTYFVRAYNGSSFTDSNTITIECFASAPDAPIDVEGSCILDVENDTPALLLQWQVPSLTNIVNLGIYRNNDLIATTTPTATSFIDTSVGQGIVYSYNISTINNVSAETKSRTVRVESCTVGNAPELFKGTCGINQFALESEYFVTLNWKIPTQYSDNIAKQTIARDGVVIATLDSNQRQYTDHNRPVGNTSTYTLTVYAQNGITTVTGSTSVTC